MKNIVFITTISLFVFGCRPNPSKEAFVGQDMGIATQQLDAAVTHIPTDYVNYGPRSFKEGKVLYIKDSLDWTVGFFPGTLWYSYEYSKDATRKAQAKRFTDAIEGVKYNTAHHDIGFMIQCSFGNGYRLTGNEHYREVMIQAARSLITRFNPHVGCILSWNPNENWLKDKGWQYPVIIDNLMNLELLFNATKFTGDSSFYRIAVSHADVTLKNHYRPDYSCYHVIDYDSITGAVRNRHTAQGYAHETSWARGQAWGLYGFTMCYRETGYKHYLEQAEKITRWWLSHKNLPKDMIPYWDFDAPDNTPAGESTTIAPSSEKVLRDASAAAITSSALLELASFGTAQSKEYAAAAEKTLMTLSSSEYFAKPGENGYFILKHCVGSIPHSQEIDTPVNYADYYFLEALMRYLNQKH